MSAGSRRLQGDQRQRRARGRRSGAHRDRRPTGRGAVTEGAPGRQIGRRRVRHPADGTTGAQDVIGIAEEALAAVARPVTIAGHPYRSPPAQAWSTDRDGGRLGRPGSGRRHHAVLGEDGRQGSWALFDSQRSDREVAQYTLARMLPAALDGDEFRLHYQPLFSLATGAPTGVEALLRWQHPWLGQIMPDRFIGARRTSASSCPSAAGCCTPPAGRRAPGPRRSDRPLCVSVNIAMRQLADPAADRPDHQGPRRERFGSNAIAARADRDERSSAATVNRSRRSGAGRPRGSDRHRRLRHRLLQHDLPPPAAGLRTEARRVLHRRTAPARRTAATPRRRSSNRSCRWRTTWA